MFRKLPGGEAAGLVSTTPDTAVVFQPTVVKTPAIATIAIALYRLIRGLIRTAIAHPLLGGAVLVLAGLWSWAGHWIAPTLAAVLGLLTFTAAGLIWPGVYRRAGHLALAGWRRFWVYRRHWQPVMIVSGIGKHMQGRDYLPHLVTVRCDAHADYVYVKMLKGQDVADWEKRLGHLAHGFDAPSARVEVVKAGRLRLTFPRKDPLAKPFGAMPPPARPVVRKVPVGYREDGHVYDLKVHGTHVLITGATGSGKGSWQWSMIRGLLPAKAAGLVEIWGLDPKRMELSYGKALFDRYANTSAKCADLLEEAVQRMQERADSFSGVRRDHTPTKEDPFIVIVVDEIAFLTAYQHDRKLKDRIKDALATIATQGRSVGFSLVAALQDPRKEVMNIRNLFPDKIALRLDESEQVDMVLGDGARDRGALADEISPNPEQGAGIGYVRLETSPEPVRVRAAYVSDADIRQMASDYARLRLVEGEVA